MDDIRIMIDKMNSENARDARAIKAGKAQLQEFMERCEKHDKTAAELHREYSDKERELESVIERIKAL